MSSISVFLPEPLKLFVEEQVSKGGYNSASEYLVDLIREAQRRAHQRELEAMLLAGLESPSSETTDDQWSELREPIIARIPELQGSRMTGRVVRSDVAFADLADERLEHDPTFLRRIEQARRSIEAGKGTRLEDIEDPA
jgi:antitoxin ParD1/3/4